MFLFFFYRVGQRMTTDTPSGTQNFIESIIDFIDENVRGSFNGKNPLVPPLALTVFIWIMQNSINKNTPIARPKVAFGSVVGTTLKNTWCGSAPKTTPIC
jgi:F0F1-type ATP synthase membrane subunit a